MKLKPSVSVPVRARARAPKARKCCAAAVSSSNDLISDLTRQVQDREAAFGKYVGANKAARDLLDFISASELRRLADKVQLVCAAANYADKVCELFINVAGVLQRAAELADRMPELETDSRDVYRGDGGSDKFNEVIRGLKR